MTNASWEPANGKVVVLHMIDRSRIAPGFADWTDEELAAELEFVRRNEKLIAKNKRREQKWRVMLSALDAAAMLPDQPGAIAHD